MFRNAQRKEKSKTLIDQKYPGNKGREGGLISKKSNRTDADWSELREGGLIFTTMLKEK